MHHRKIVGAIAQCGGHRWLALQGVAPAMPHVSDELRVSIIEEIPSLTAPSQAEVLEKLGPIRPHLSAEQRQALIAIAASIEDPRLRAQARVGLAESGAA